MKDKVTIVYTIKWHNEWDEEGVYLAPTYTTKIRKIFHNLDDALAYINSVENQKAPDIEYPRTHAYITKDDESASGFYLIQEQFEVE